MSKLTNAMREELLDNLTAKAVEAEAGRIGTLLDLLNKNFWLAHRLEVEKLLPRDLWGPLLGSGALNVTATCTLTARDENGDVTYPFYLRTDNDDWRLRLLRKPEMAKVWCHIGTRGYNSARVFALNSPGGSVPYLSNMDDVSGELAALAWRCGKALDDLLKAAESFRDQATTVLWSCHSYKQLEELFPEAAKLMAPPVKKTTAVAPIELARNVAAMLNAGLPPVLEMTK